MSFRISAWQAFLMVFLTSLCVTPFGFPLLHAELERHIWVASVAQLGITLVGALGVLLLLLRFPGDSLRTLTEEVAGRVPGRGYLLMLAVYLFFWGPVGNQYALMSIIQSADLPATSPYIIATAIIAVALYAAYFGPEVIGRSLELQALLLLPILAVIVIVPLLAGDPGRVLPLAGMPSGALESPDFWSFGLGLRGFILLLAFMGMFTVGGRIYGSLLGGSVAAAVAVGILVLLPYTVFYPETVARFHFPTLEAMDVVDITGLGLQSFLSVTLFIWYMVGWVVVATTLFAAAWILAATFGVQSHRWFLVPLAAAAVFITAYPIPQGVHFLIMYGWSALGYAVGVLAPWVFLGLAVARGLPRGGGGR